jgi:hypothetical protein
MTFQAIVMKHTVYPSGKVISTSINDRCARRLQYVHCHVTGIRMHETLREIVETSSMGILCHQDEGTL